MLFWTVKRRKLFTESYRNSSIDFSRRRDAGQIRRGHPPLFGMSVWYGVRIRLHGVPDRRPDDGVCPRLIPSVLRRREKSIELSRTFREQQKPRTDYTPQNRTVLLIVTRKNFSKGRNSRNINTMIDAVRKTRTNEIVKAHTLTIGISFQTVTFALFDTDFQIIIRLCNPFIIIDYL